ncbi:hypothetical protein E2C01_075914 [Portunus trituberculatus]|uniref:Uncharacterized protein n=1 Tax=Portunus trituberculatus TaxID=210409 RepID=A0A5B7IIC0_PORTR|nr:hypothetical protein [Portunus trituberculatus]
MARSATRGAFVSPDASIMQRMRGRWEQLYFDYSLKYVCWCAALVKHCPLVFEMEMYMNIMSYEQNFL